MKEPSGLEGVWGRGLLQVEGKACPGAAIRADTWVTREAAREGLGDRVVKAEAMASAEGLG